jgi:hypothetical protein
MKRKFSLLLITFLLAAFPMPAEVLQMELSIFGMD